MSDFAPKHLILFRKDDQRIARTFQFVSKSESTLAETLLVGDESGFGLRPETGNGLTDHCSEKPQCFTDFGQVVVFSAASRRAGVNVDRAWIQALQLSAVSGKDATG